MTPHDQVAAIANAVYAAGNKEPGTKVIRDELAKRAGPGMPIGSPNTVQKHLGVWREKARPIDPPGPAPQLPPQLAADIGRALNAAAAIAKEESESRLQQVRAELADLAENGESFEIQIDELTQALAARTSERDTLVGQLKEQASEVQELKATFEREQATAEALRLDCAKAQIKSETADSRVAEVLSREGDLRSELAAVRNDLAAVQQVILAQGALPRTTGPGELITLQWCRRSVGYGRLSGRAAANALATLYKSSRLYINYPQPSSKLKSRTRDGSRVRGVYFTPRIETWRSAHVTALALGGLRKTAAAPING